MIDPTALMAMLARPGVNKVPLTLSPLAQRGQSFNPAQMVPGERTSRILSTLFGLDPGTQKPGVSGNPALGDALFYGGLSLLGAPKTPGTFMQNLAGAIGQGSMAGQQAQMQQDTLAAQQARRQALMSMNLPEQTKRMLLLLDPAAQSNALSQLALREDDAPEGFTLGQNEVRYGPDGRPIASNMARPTAAEPKYEYRDLSDGTVGVFLNGKMVGVEGPKKPAGTGPSPADEWGLRDRLASDSKELQDVANNVFPTAKKILDILDTDVRTGPGARIMAGLGNLFGTSDSQAIVLLNQYLDQLGIAGLSQFKGAISEKELAKALQNAGTVEMRKDALRSWVTRKLDAMSSRFDDHNRNVAALSSGNPMVMDVLGVQKDLYGWWGERNKGDELPEILPTPNPSTPLGGRWRR